MPSIFAKAIARGAIAIVIVAIAWELAATASSPYVMPHLAPVLGKIVKLVVTADFWTHASATLFRIFAGYVLALLVGLPLGLGLRLAPELRFAVGALFSGLAAVPFVLLAPATILWFGLRNGSKIALAFAAAAVVLIGELTGPQAAASASAAGDLPPPPPTYRAPLGPSVVQALRLSFFVAVGAVLVGEMLGSQTGLGYLVTNAMTMLDVVTMFAVVIMVALPCALISALLRSIEVQVG